jgi:triosephosphate isomerase (TIM)
MRKKIAAGNWKMNSSLQDGVQLAKQIQQFAASFPLDNKGIVLAPPFTHIVSIVNEVISSNVSVAAQNCAAWEKGAYTGEISAEMIASTGAHYIIIGHSERRQYFKEDNATLYTKVQLCLKNSLLPIYCCGEMLQERESEKQYEIVKTQLEEGIFGLKPEDFSKVVIAYEPVWAIGTGKTATPAQAQDMHAFIRKIIAGKYGSKVSSEITILYGGSCNAANAKELFSQPDVDGGLVGGASLKANEFIEIIKAL